MKSKLMSLLTLSMLILVLATGCSSSKPQNANNTIQDTSENEPSSTKTKSDEPTTKPTPKPAKKKLTKKEKYQNYAKKIKIKVYNKKVLPIDFDAGRFSEFIEFDYKVINKSSKAIKGIKGTLYVYDQFDEEITSISWDVSVGEIGAGKTKKVTNYGLDYNQFLDTHNKLYNLEYEDMIFKYEMQQVNFADGYKLKF